MVQSQYPRASSDTAPSRHFVSHIRGGTKYKDFKRLYKFSEALDEAET